ncbi:MAG: ABC transporter ATP-binding protein [Clostridium sp.]|nr:ABC transporter ATP-binding protein [Acetatifactor muris]MCM1527680.1 ABC transporter ATP-binding protein [Bacteroides sp.]MCM1563376.1 ABC transporter ATP-binding protein [Clostridium sp.]
MNLLKIDQLQKTYGNFHLDCTMEVPAGRISGLIGPNGAGKTTVFKAALGLIRPEGGSVELLGRPAGQLTVKEKSLCGVALSDSGFSGYLNVRDVAAVMGRLYQNFDGQDFLEKCGRFGLPINKKIKEFSTGMRAKFKVLVAVSHGAKFLILDEPTAGLDVMARDEVLTILREFMEEGEDRGILVSSHISADLESLCDDVWMIDRGRIILHEETDVLLDEYGILKVDGSVYEGLDKRYLLRVSRESYGYRCLTGQRDFYRENYPDIVVEKNGLDELIYMMIKGEKVC